MPFVTSGGVRIHYTDTGGDGRVVVLGHSLFMDQEMFAPQVQALTPDYRLIAIDSRGHGPSEDPGTPFSYWDLARDAWAVVDALGLEHVVVGGVAHGGFTALRMALLAHSRVDGLIVIGSTAAAMPARRKVGYREGGAVCHHHEVIDIDHRAHQWSGPVVLVTDHAPPHTGDDTVAPAPSDSGPGHASDGFHVRTRFTQRHFSRCHADPVNLPGINEMATAAEFRTSRA